MKQFFLDTNVIIDFLANRDPFAESASQLFTLQTEKKLKIYCSAISFNNIYFLLRQSISNMAAIRLLKILASMTEIVALDDKVIAQSFNSGFRDFEDAIQYHSALGLSKLDGIVTRNTRDFAKSKLSVLSPKEALSLF